MTKSGKPDLVRNEVLSFRFSVLELIQNFVGLVKIKVRIVVVGCGKELFIIL
jgi:hypothetical protein